MCCPRLPAVHPSRLATAALLATAMAVQAGGLGTPGLSDRIELQADASNLSATLPLRGAAVDDPSHLHGFTDTSFGATWRVRGGDAGWLPGVSWLADVASNAGSPTFRGPEVRPSLRATAEWALDSDLSLGVMPGVYRDRDDDTGHHFIAGVLAVTLGKAWTPRLRSFVGVAGERLANDQHGASATLDSGVTFAATPSLRVDVVLSHGFAGESTGIQGGIGLSTRF